MAIVGNTVRLTAEFKTFNDVYSNPTDITLKIYNKRNIQVGDTISITAEHKTSTGIYSYDYTIPSGNDELIYEFSGMLEGTAILGRSAIVVGWV